MRVSLSLCLTSFPRGSETGAEGGWSLEFGSYHCTKLRGGEFAGGVLVGCLVSSSFCFCFIFLFVILST